MEETYLSDINLFTNDITFIMESKNITRQLEKLYQKHQYEVHDKLPVSIKKNDLIIWNAVYLREIIKLGTTKCSLHVIYNKFYKKIQTLNTIAELQELEINMATSYFNILIDETESTDNYTLNKILQYLNVNIENYVSLDKLAKDLNISKGYASDCFKKNMGVSLMKYLKKLKIERAKTLLLSSNLSILDISILLGFYDQSHFSRLFKSIVGITPTEYRNQNYS